MSDRPLVCRACREAMPDIDWTRPCPHWKETPEHIASLEAEIAELKHLHQNQMANALQQKMRAEVAERVARTLYDLWPVGFWATLKSISDDHPWLEDSTRDAAEAAGGE